MGLRMNIPLPGPFSISTSSHGRRVTVWRHPGCKVGHRSQKAADQHHARLAARTPAQVRRAKTTGLVVGSSVAAAFVAGIGAALVTFASSL